MESDSNDEFNFLPYFKILLEKKSVVAFISLISLGFGLIYSLSAKKIWEGQFQIVIADDKKDLTSGLLTGGLANSFKEKLGSARKLKTQVEILRSPSVLMPIFDFVKANKKYPYRKTFKKWKKQSLYIELERGTSILNLAYRDNNKELILPTLSKIEEAYKTYSSKEEYNSLVRSLDYTELQISKYQKSYEESQRLLNDFSLKYGIYIIDSNAKNQLRLRKDLNSKEKINFDPGENLLTTNLEFERISSENKIRSINEELKKIEIDTIDPKYIYTFGKSIFDKYLINEDESLTRLKFHIADIGSDELIYTENDKDLIIKQQKGTYLANQLKERLIDYLVSLKQIENAKINSVSRPDDVILQFKKYYISAKIDQTTLDNLRNQSRNISLEIARSSDPWQLITKPTLLINPVAPSKKIICLFSLLFGIFAGSGYAIYLYKKEGFLFTVDEIRQISKVAYVEKFPNYLDENSKYFFRFFLNLEAERANIKSINFLKIGNLTFDQEVEVTTLLSECLNLKKVTLRKNLSEINNEGEIVILVFSGITKKETLQKSLDQIRFLKKEVKSILVFDIKKTK